MEMTLHSVLKDKRDALYSVPADATVFRAVEVMVEGGVGSAMIMDHSRLVGVFTERDLMVRVIYPGLDPKTTPIRDVMTREIATVAPTITVSEAMTLCTEKRFRHLPVFDGDTLLGVVSAGDLARWAVDDQQHTIDDLVKYIYGYRG